MASGAELSAYELQRLSNVQRNREALAALGIEPLVEPQKREVKKRPRRAPVPAA